MGSGKGSPEWWIANVKPGRVLFELSFPNEKVAREALTRAIHKLPMKCRIVTREAGESDGDDHDRTSCASCTTTSSTTRLREAKEELFNLRFQMATGQLDNNRRLRTVSHDIARIYTILRERELGLSVAPSER